MRGDARQWPIREERLLTVHTLNSLEDDCGMDRVRRYRLLMPFQECTHHKLLAEEKI